jgi:hypothetical protein
VAGIGCHSFFIFHIFYDIHTLIQYIYSSPFAEVSLHYLLHHFHVVNHRATFPTKRRRIWNEVFIHFWILGNFSLPCPLQTQYQEEAGKHGGALQTWEVADGRGWRKVRSCTVPYVPVQFSGFVTVWEGSGSLDPNIGLRIRILLFSSLACTCKIQTKSKKKDYQYKSLRSTKQLKSRFFSVFCLLVEGSGIRNTAYHMC